MGKLFKFSATAIDEFLSCRRKYYFNRIQNIKPVERPDALDFGSAVHRGLESIMRSMANTDDGDREFEEAINAREIAREYALQAVRDYAEEYCMNDESKCKALALIDSYIDLYFLDDLKDFEVLAIEQYFEAPINEVPDVKTCMHGYFDGVVKNRNTGEIYVMEHKTTGMMGDDYLAKSHIDWQVIIYMLACKHKYGRCDGVFYDAISKPKHSMSVGETDEEFDARKAASKTGRIKRKEAETQEQFISRVQSSFGEDTFKREFIDSKSVNLEQQLHDLDEIADDIIYCNCHYRCTGNCLKFGACPYLDLCTGKVTLDNLGDKYVNCDKENEEV
jgi:hypothetical protein